MKRVGGKKVPDAHSNQETAQETQNSAEWRAAQGRTKHKGPSLNVHNSQLRGVKPVSTEKAGC